MGGGVYILPCVYEQARACVTRQYFVLSTFVLSSIGS